MPVSRRIPLLPLIAVFAAIAGTAPSVDAQGRRRYYAPDSALRLEVLPKDAQVYVDGYYSGVVDDFDGAFQRLRLPPGEHELTLYRAGYKSAHQMVYLTPDATFNVRVTMEPLAAGEPAEPRPVPAASPAAGSAAPEAPPFPPAGPGGRRLPPPGGRPDPRGAQNRRGATGGSYGTLAVRVQPADAVVLIDGERWQGSEGQERLFVEVPAGSHRVEIQKEGYEPFSADIDVRGDDATPLNVSLRPGPPPSRP
jgi:hypothetical protein